ncbi:hypothetical protein B0H14DRAFT_3438534 [Mycena olivaceomarginata]|nr:hypothetical protein B0H14DRAFT_3438534 [Mycena olivaceomarginata]
MLSADFPSTPLDLPSTSSPACPPPSPASYLASATHQCRFSGLTWLPILRNSHWAGACLGATTSSPSFFWAPYATDLVIDWGDHNGSFGLQEFVLAYKHITNRPPQGSWAFHILLGLIITTSHTSRRLACCSTLPRVTQGHRAPVPHGSPPSAHSPPPAAHASPSSALASLTLHATLAFGTPPRPSTRYLLSACITPSFPLPFFAPSRSRCALPPLPRASAAFRTLPPSFRVPYRPRRTPPTLGARCPAHLARYPTFSTPPRPSTHYPPSERIAPPFPPLLRVSARFCGLPRATPSFREPYRPRCTPPAFSAFCLALPRTPAFSLALPRPPSHCPVPRASARYLGLPRVAPLSVLDVRPFRVPPRPQQTHPRHSVHCLALPCITPPSARAAPPSALAYPPLISFWPLITDVWSLPLVLPLVSLVSRLALFCVLGTQDTVWND